MPSKGKGFQRLAAMEVTDSGTDDDSQPLRSTKRYQYRSGVSAHWFVASRSSIVY